MILLTLFIAYLFKINFISCQIPAAPIKSGYNQVLAKHLFILSIDSYSKFPGKCMPKLVSYFRSYVCIKTESPICDKQKNICPFYLLADARTRNMILVFSGSRSMLQSFNIAISMHAKRKNFFGMGDVNEYFFKAHISMWKHLENILKNQLYKDFKFFVTGHSLGGALAALVALRIQIMNIKRSEDIILYTYGEPRVGTLSFATNFDLRVPQSYRIVNGFDFIAHLPSCTKMKLRNSRNSFKKKTLPCSREDINGYYHHGTEIWYSKGSKPTDIYFECLGAPKNEDFKCSDSLLFKPNEYRKLRLDHSTYFMEFQVQYKHIVNQHIYPNCTKY